MKKIINNLSPILSAVGIVLMLIPWLIGVPDIMSLVPTGFVIALFGLFVEFKYVDNASNDVIDDLSEEDTFDWMDNDLSDVISDDSGQDVEQQQLDDYLRSEQFIIDFRKQVEKDTWDHGLPMTYMNDNNQLVRHYRDGRIEIIKDLSSEKDINKNIKMINDKLNEPGEDA